MSRAAEAVLDCTEDCELVVVERRRGRPSVGWTEVTGVQGPRSGRGAAPRAWLPDPAGPPGSFGSLDVPGVIKRTCDVVLEEYRWNDDPHAAATLRAVNNGHSAAWRVWDGGVMPAGGIHAGSPPFRPELHAVWRVDNAGFQGLRYRVFRTDAQGWVADYRSARSCGHQREPQPPASSGLMWYVNLAVRRSGEVVVGWLDHVGGRVGICQTTVTEAREFPTSARVGVWRGERDLKYLGLAVGLGGTQYVGTQDVPFPAIDPDTGLMTWDVVAYYAHTFSTTGSRLRLRYFDTLVGRTTERASDPSVASSSDGRLMVWVWEEKEEADPVDREDRRTFLMVMYGRRADPLSPMVYDGPFMVLDEAGEPVPGGDPCVYVLERGVYLAYQFLDGGIHLRRLALPQAGPFTGDLRWLGAAVSDGATHTHASTLDPRRSANRADR